MIKARVRPAVVMLISHDYIVAEGICVDILFIKCKLVRCDVIFVIVKSAKTVGYYFFYLASNGTQGLK